MNNLKKVGLTALAGALVSVSANALDVSVSGGASISFSGEEQQTTGNGWSMNDGITFSSSGEMDNGMTVTVTQILNNDDVLQTECLILSLLQSTWVILEHSHSMVQVEVQY